MAIPPVIQLPPVTVYAFKENPPDPYWGYGDSASPYMPEGPLPPVDLPGAAYSACVNGPALFAKAQEGNPSALLEELCKQVSNRNAALAINQFKVWGQYTDYLSQQWGNEGLPPSRGMTMAQTTAAEYLSSIAGNYVYRANTGAFDINTMGTEWVGSVFLPIKAIWHWVNGNGAQVNMPVSALDLDIKPSAIQGDMSSFLKQPMQYGANLFQRPFSYNTFANASDLWAAGTVGRVSGTMIGLIWVNDDGSYIFDASFYLNPDVFDAGKSNRPWPQEALTDFLKWIGDTWGHTDYTIKFNGSDRLYFEGHLDVNGKPVLPF